MVLNEQTYGLNTQLTKSQLLQIALSHQMLDKLLNDGELEDGFAINSNKRGQSNDRSNGNILHHVFITWNIPITIELSIQKHTKLHNYLLYRC